MVGYTTYKNGDGWGMVYVFLPHITTSKSG